MLSCDLRFLYLLLGGTSCDLGLFGSFVFVTELLVSPFIVETNYLGWSAVGEAGCLVMLKETPFGDFALEDSEVLPLELLDGHR